MSSLTGLSCKRALDKMAHPFKQKTEEHTKEIGMQDFYNSLDDHLKGEYRNVQVYQIRLKELREDYLELEMQGSGIICHNLKGSIATLDNYLQGDYKDMADSMPDFRRILETVIIETESDLCEIKGKLMQSKIDKVSLWDNYLYGGKR